MDVYKGWKREGGGSQKSHASDAPGITDVIQSAFPGEKKFSRAHVILIPFFFRIQQVGNEAYVLGLSSFHIPSIGAACVCFLELLGLDSLKLRVDMKVANIILSYTCRNEDAQYNLIRESLGTAPLCHLFCWEDKGQIGLRHWIVSGWGGNSYLLFHPFSAEFLHFISLYWAL